MDIINYTTGIVKKFSHFKCEFFFKLGLIP